MAEAWFSLDGDRFQTNPLRVVLPADRNREAARNISMQLRSRSAKFIKLRLHFADKWLMLSEVSFESGKRTAKQLETTTGVSFDLINRWRPFTIKLFGNKLARITSPSFFLLHSWHCYTFTKFENSLCFIYRAVT